MDGKEEEKEKEEEGRIWRRVFEHAAVMVRPQNKASNRP